MGSDFAGTTLDATYQGVTTVVQGFYTAGPGNGNALLTALMSIPEPGTASLVALGLASLAIIRRSSAQR